MEEIEVSSLQDFEASVLHLAQASLSGHLWFRGCGSRTHVLLPSLYRHPAILGVEELLALELRLLTRFRQRSLPFLEGRTLESNWDYLFLMQHYGVPTRLLDWSENAYVALWFAVIGASVDDSAVWVLDPTKWNRQVLAYQSYDRDVLSVGDLALGGYEVGVEQDNMNTAPVALYGTHNSPRIVAQRGVFTVAGKDLTGMDSFLGGFADPIGCLSIIVVPNGARAQILTELRQVGFAESMIYPDLDGLARELRATEGF